jgi:hypothetical protein
LPINGAAETQALNMDNIEGKKPKSRYPSVVMALIRTFKSTLLAGILYKLSFDMIQFGFPQLLSMLINFVESGTEPTWYGVSIAVAMFLIATIQSLVYNIGLTITHFLDLTPIFPFNVPLRNEYQIHLNGMCLQKGRNFKVIINQLYF